MTFLEAIKTGLPLTRINRVWSYRAVATDTFAARRDRGFVTPGTFIEPSFFLEMIFFTPEDICANDWVVKNDLDKEWV